MDISVFFAKFFGIYFLISAFFWTFFKSKIRCAAFTILNNEGLVRFTGLISLAIGIALIVSHPRVTQDIHILLIVVGIVCLVNGIARLFFYSKFKNLSIRMIDGNFYYVSIIVLWVAGIYLSYLGFSAHPHTQMMHWF